MFPFVFQFALLRCFLWLRGLKVIPSLSSMNFALVFLLVALVFPLQLHLFFACYVSLVVHLKVWFCDCSFRWRVMHVCVHVLCFFPIYSFFACLVFYCGGFPSLLTLLLFLRSFPFVLQLPLLRCSLWFPGVKVIPYHWSSVPFGCFDFKSNLENVVLCSYFSIYRTVPNNNKQLIKSIKIGLNWIYRRIQAKVRYFVSNWVKFVMFVFAFNIISHFAELPN